MAQASLVEHDDPDREFRRAGRRAAAVEAVYAVIGLLETLIT